MFDLYRNNANRKVISHFYWALTMEYRTLDWSVSGLNLSSYNFYYSAKYQKLELFPSSGECVERHLLSRVYAASSG